ncbi:MAG: NUDIX domain-containing protein [Myxococcota bacterium]|nr:NUDIX domain-containing protein [Myxococcota bacterium]
MENRKRKRRSDARTRKPRPQQAPPQQRPRRRRRRGRGCDVPDIVYHGTTRARANRHLRTGFVDAPGGRQVFLSDSEDDAWRIAHRFPDEPVVLYVDAGRARRDGVRFHRTRSGLYVANRIPVRHVLNLRRGFREQVSAGGFLVRRDRGQVELALVSCERRSGTTWEIAKGKLEPGETPQMAAVRELQEEMGFQASVSISDNLGMVRYGFQTPEGEPRLKSLHVYLIDVHDAPERFTPARGEGICEVRWFSIPEAFDRVTHTSLKPLMRMLLERFGGLPEDYPEAP